ncbi:MAG: transcription antitermination factor NusB [Candidatus Cloacimonetes bacterium HGW-Cloacimonetes-3]|jgi:N utilization substance protein B|nr:MAG: transcription antitermination factor NusB [Candidatus Cloacimonetes bacterium HGW-Cloacimonetes-3]
MGQRRKAREMAVQCLYSLEFSEVESEFREYGLLNEYPEILANLGTSENMNATTSVYAFADELVKNTIINISDVEAEIDKHTDNWSLDSIARLDRSILSVAVYELLFTDTPAAVVINEAIEIAKRFCSEPTGKFINGILDAVHKEITQRDKMLK